MPGANDSFSESAARDASTDFESTARHQPAEVLVPGLTVLYHPHLERIGERAFLDQLSARGEALLSRTEPLFAAPARELRRPLADSRLSRKPLHIRSGPRETLRIERGASRTAIEIEGQPLENGGRTISPAELERGVVLLLGGSVVLLLHLADPFVPADLPAHGLVGESPAMLRVRREIRQVADLRVPVLVRGESGTGKELVARAIHSSSPRHDGPYIALNMASIPPSLAASELFGSVKGAYTGADRPRQGFFRRAASGTLFLDEIGETPPEVQVQLLRALESGEIQPVGSEETRAVDVRVISATDADLESAAREARFRAPLLHRLSGFILRLPRLAERREDFGRLLLHFLRQELAAIDAADRLEPARHPWLPAPLVARLVRHDWPGNVRQLRNVVRQLVITHRDAGRVGLGSGSVEALLAELAASREPPEPEHPPGQRKPSKIDEEELIEALRQQRFELTATAKTLGISRPSLYNLIKKSDRIRTATDLDRAQISASFERHDGDPAAMAAELEVSEKALRRRLARMFPASTEDSS